MRKNTISTNLILIAALLCLAMLCGCGKKKDDAKRNPDPVKLSVISKDGQLELDFNDTDTGKQIIQDYVNFITDDCRPYCSDSDRQLLINKLFIKVYYGTYNGYIPVAIGYKCEYVSCFEERDRYPDIGSWHLPMTSIIDDIKFHFKRRSDEIIVWHGGHFYGLGPAYDNGWLTYEDLRKIADYHEFIYESKDMPEQEND